MSAMSRREVLALAGATLTAAAPAPLSPPRICIFSKHLQWLNVADAARLAADIGFDGPCGVPETIVNAKGKQRRIYRWYATPWEILRQLPDLARHLRPESSIHELERKANAQSDTQAAANMQSAKCKLFAMIFRRRTA